jgi:uncharacterized repeat protein (TIGR01451 family)
VTLIQPAIAIAKTPDTQMVRSGGTVTFTLSVTNTGDAALSNVTVSDAQASDCARPIGPLAVGDHTSYTCTQANVLASFTNVATATGTPPAGPNVSDGDSAAVTVINPAIAIAKTPDSQTVVSGDPVTFTLAVTNTGDATLSNVAVTDPQASNCAHTIGDLGAHLSQTYTCTRTGVTADFTNVATATGTPPVGPAVTASDTASVDVIHPAIQVIKEANAITATVGEVITYTYTVENIGDVLLTNVNASDDRLGAISLGSTTLAPTEITTGTATYLVGESDLPGPITSTVTVTGTSLVGPEVEVNDTNTIVVYVEPAPASPGTIIYLPLILKNN